VAVNIVREADYAVFGYTPAAGRRAVPMAPDRLAQVADGRAGPAGSSPADGPAAVELLDLLAEAVRDGGMPAEDAGLLAQLFVLSVPLAELASRYGVSERSVRSRRRAAMARLVAWMGTWMPAAASSQAAAAPISPGPPSPRAA
jgi:DNA-directed RNA polymerase specialized sigma24 family protein